MSNKEDLLDIIWINRENVLLNMDILRYFELRSSFRLSQMYVCRVSACNEVKLV